jgi:anti-anti-sigma factor
MKPIDTVDVVRVKLRTKPIDTSDVGDTVRVKLGMRLTSNEVPTLAEELKKEIDDGVTRIVFDMAETVTIDSRGISFLIAMSNIVSAMQGRVRLVNVSPNIREGFESIMEFLNLFHS